MRKAYEIMLLIAFVVSGCTKSPVQNQSTRGTLEQNTSNPTGRPGSGMSPEQLAIFHQSVKSCNGCHTTDRPPAPHDQTADCVSCHTYPAWKGGFSATIHDPKPASCNGCHEPDRPPLPHVAKEDCVGCHNFPSFTQVASSFNHEPKPASCNGCHEAKRPPPPHVAGQDCVGCHNFPSFTQVSFSHTPRPATCEGCHARPTTVGLRAYPNQGPPPGFNANDPNAPGGRHYVGKDCGACHATPDEGAVSFAFTHSQPRANFCLPCHFNDGRAEHPNQNNVQLTGFGNCFTCHTNYDRNVLRNWDRN